MNTLEKIEAITYSIKEFDIQSHPSPEKVVKLKKEVPWLEINFRLEDKIFKVFSHYCYNNRWVLVWRCYYNFRYQLDIKQAAYLLCNVLDIDLQRPELPDKVRIFCNALNISHESFVVSEVKEFLLQVIDSSEQFESIFKLHPRRR